MKLKKTKQKKKLRWEWPVIAEQVGSAVTL
jgi:hypothetical protein